jgi:biopolymer transport protein ExbB
MYLPIFANVVVDLFLKGGPVMYPILLAALVAVAVIGERVFWWTRLASRRDAAQLEKIFAAMEAADFPAASGLARESNDPVVRMIYHGLNHHHSSLQGALQVAAGLELQQAGRFLPALDTLVTLAPLLGLLGTVTGIMGSFTSIGGEELAVTRVTGGIGEALIATACGLGIAIITLIPFNYFNARVARLQFELEAAATNVEVMINNAKQQGLSTHTEPVARH